MSFLRLYENVILKTCLGRNVDNIRGNNKSRLETIIGMLLANCFGKTRGIQEIGPLPGIGIGLQGRDLMGNRMWP